MYSITLYYRLTSTVEFFGLHCALRHDLNCSPSATRSVSSVSFPLFLLDDSLTFIQLGLPPLLVDAYVFGWDKICTRKRN